MISLDYSMIKEDMVLKENQNNHLMLSNISCMNATLVCQWSRTNIVEPLNFRKRNNLHHEDCKKLSEKDLEVEMEVIGNQR